MAALIVPAVIVCLLQMILYYKKQHGTGLPLRHTLTVGLHVASALWHLHPSIVHRWVVKAPAQALNALRCRSLVPGMQCQPSVLAAHQHDLEYGKNMCSTPLHRVVRLHG